MLATDHFFTPSESSEYFGSTEKPGKVFDVFTLAAKLYKENAVIESLPELRHFVDMSLLTELIGNND